MRKIVLFALLLGFVAPLVAQKTIFALWDMPVKGCSLAEKSTAPNRGGMSSAVEDGIPGWGDRAMEVPAGFSSLAAVVDSLGQIIASQNQAHPDFFAPRIKWGDELVFFKENGKWGLINDQQKVLIAAQFDHVIAKAGQPGFVGYKSGRCNYYTKEGQPYFEENYLHIKPTAWGSFLVRAVTGFGFVDEEGEELLSPIYQNIRITDQGEKSYAFVSVNKQESFLYHLKDGQQTFYVAAGHSWRFIDDRYALVNEQALIDLEQNRLVFCAEGLRIKIVDRKHLLFAISRKEAPEEYRLINHEGKLLSKEVFSAIGNRMSNGMIAAAVPRPYEPGGRKIMDYGLLDQKGKWAVAPSYPNGIHNLVADRFIPLNKSYYEITLMSLQGDTLLPLLPYRKFEVTEDGKSLKALYIKDKVYQAYLLDLSTNEATALDDPGYWDKKPFNICEEETLYLATSQEGQVLLDKDGRPLLEEPVSRISKGAEPGTYNLSIKVNQENRKGSYMQWVSCDGQPRVFQIEGEEVDTFKGYFKLADDFFLVKKEKETAHFVFPDGQSAAATHQWSGMTRRLGDYFQLRDGRKEGIITASGETIMPPLFSVLYVDKQLGLIRYELEEEKPQYLGLDGVRLFPDRYDEVHTSTMGSFRVKKNGKWGLIDLEGKVILPTEYKYLYLSDGVIKASKSTYKQEELFDLIGNPLGG